MKKIKLFTLLLVLGAIGSALVGNPINQALWNNNSEKALKLIEENPELVSQTNKWGGTPLHVAAKRGDFEVALKLIEAGANISETNNGGRTPLHMAASGKCGKTFALLIKSGANANASDNYGYTPLHLASFRGKAERLETLLNAGSDPNALTESGETALMILASNGHAKGAKLLLPYTDPINAQDENSRTALMFAARNGMTDLVNLLLAKGADPNIQDKQNGHTALHLASIRGYEDIGAILKKNKTNAKVEDFKGNKAKEYVAQYLKPTKRSSFAKVSSTAGEAADAEIVYAGHSGWIVKTKENILVFDYHKPNRPPTYPSLNNGYLTSEDANGLPVTVFTTHHHWDHHNPKALATLKNVSENINWVYGFKPKKAAQKTLAQSEAKASSCASADKTEKAKMEKKSKEKSKQWNKQKTDLANLHIMKPNASKIIGNMEVATIKSNDAGVGFLVKVDGISIFHAGDHAKVNFETADSYDKEIDYLVARNANVDIVFSPVSGCPSRWKKDAIIDGFFDSAKKLNAKVVFPMHGLDREFDYLEFAKLAAERDFAATVHCAENPGDRFSYTKSATTLANR